MTQRVWKPLSSLALLAALAAGAALARQAVSSCATHRYRALEEKFLHQRHVEQQAIERLAQMSLGGRLAQTPPDRTATADSGDIVLIDDSGGVVGRRNPFSLDGHTVRFVPTTPGAAKYRFETAGDTYNPAPAQDGLKLSLGDQSSQGVPLPFAFPFYGQTYNGMYVNSDGNITFGRSDAAPLDYPLGTLVAGPPRIAPLLVDLDPSLSPQGVIVSARDTMVTVSWVLVPLHDAGGPLPAHTFQIRLFPDGTIELAFRSINLQDATTGISPGGLAAPPALVSFLITPSAEYGSAVAEKFISADEIDLISAAQRFYEAHEDSYDYLVIYNALNIPAFLGAVAFETTVRNNREGYGDSPVDDGALYGSRRRLQAVLNMGPVSQYPADPNGIVPARATPRDTPLTILGHEAGHLFLAFVSVPDPTNPFGKPMLGRANAHWSFFYNSDASLLEGNRLTDYGPATKPQFASTGTVQAYSALDQYLMGFRASSEVPPSFYVADPDIAFFPGRAPQLGVAFNGVARPVRIEDVIAASGRRTPDYTVAQRRFRFAFLVVHAKGSPPPAAVLAQVDSYRKAFMDFYAAASGSRGTADATLKRAVNFSAWPASGIVRGQTAGAAIRLEQPAAKDLAIALRAPNGVAGVPALVTVKAGQSSAAFEMQGLKAGVEELLAIPADTQFETVHARVNVVDFAFFLKPELVSGGDQPPAGGGELARPIVVRAVDVNRVPYPSLKLSAAALGGGSVTPDEAVTDENGLASFRWSPPSDSAASLSIGISGIQGTEILVRTGSKPAISDGGILNGATFQPLLAPATFAVMFGANLAAGKTELGAPPFGATLSGVGVSVAGKSAPLVYVSDTQVNFVIPDGIASNVADVVVTTPAGPSAAAIIPLRAAAPAIFDGGVFFAGTAIRAATQPAAPGDFLEIYLTGLNGSAPEVTIGGVAARVSFAGRSAIGIGFDQINIEVPEGLASGPQPLVVKAAGQSSQPATIQIR